MRAIALPAGQTHQHTRQDDRQHGNPPGAQHGAHHRRQRQQRNVIGHVALAKPHQQKVHQQIQPKRGRPVALERFPWGHGSNTQPRTERKSRIDRAHCQQPCGACAVEIGFQALQGQQKQGHHQARRHEPLPDADAGKRCIARNGRQLIVSQAALDPVLPLAWQSGGSVVTGGGERVGDRHHDGGMSCWPEVAPQAVLQPALRA